MSLRVIFHFTKSIVYSINRPNRILSGIIYLHQNVQHPIYVRQIPSFNGVENFYHFNVQSFYKISLIPPFNIFLSISLNFEGLRRLVFGLGLKPSTWRIHNCYRLSEMGSQNCDPLYWLKDFESKSGSYSASWVCPWFFWCSSMIFFCISFLHGQVIEWYNNGKQTMT